MARSDIDLELIRQLASLLTDSELTELEIEQGDSRIRVARQSAAAGAAAPTTPVAAAPAAGGGGSDAGSHPGIVRSPMVGMLHLAPKPGAPTFVSVGDTVREGQTLLVVEAMKVMNSIAAPKAGRVLQVIAENGAPVEYDEPLMIIE